MADNKDKDKVEETTEKVEETEKAEAKTAPEISEVAAAAPSGDQEAPKKVSSKEDPLKRTVAETPKA
jgi:hypothetical protein